MHLKVLTSQKVTVADSGAHCGPAFKLGRLSHWQRAEGHLKTFAVFVLTLLAAMWKNKRWGRLSGCPVWLGGWIFNCVISPTKVIQLGELH